jgi:Ni2+-binding GTPase involved in maturation of urease and hydrogenase
MNLFVIAGFLGSGKTTLLLSIAKAVSAAGKKMVIIENEVGDIGVDDVILKGEGLEVREIFSGCICCSLRSDLISTLLEIEREYDPDIVILEPSGVASPKQVMNALVGYGGEIDNKHVAVIVDAKRYPIIMNADIPIIKDGINVADILVINKTDLADDEELEMIEQNLRKIRPEIKTLQVSTHANINVDKLINEFMAVPYKGKDKVYFDLNKDKGPAPVAYAHCFDIPVKGDFNGKIFAKELSAVLKEMSIELDQAGCKLIGHIKAIAKSPGGGYMMFSITSAGQDPDIKGLLPRRPEKLEIALNVIVYGINHDTVEKIVIKHLNKGEINNG